MGIDDSNTGLFGLSQNKTVWPRQEDMRLRLLLGLGAAREASKQTGLICGRHLPDMSGPGHD
jgi:hypothetical protein